MVDPNVRDQFPVLQKTMRGKPLIYLDSAATTQKPQRVIDAVTRFYTEEYGTVHRAVYELCRQATARYSEVREKLRAFLNAQSTQEIIYTKGTTDAINLVASSFGRSNIHNGDEVIISEMEHHSNIVPWQILCKERGAKLKFIPIDDKGELILDEFEKLLTDRTKLVAVAHIANATGTVNPIEKIIRSAHSKGARVLIDGAQAACHIPLDMQKLDADFYVFSGHKAYGPTGIGVLYGKKEILDIMPPYQGGGDMIESVTLQEFTTQKLPLKFEAGTPMIAEVIGLGEAIDFIESIGRTKIAEHEKHLTDYATAKLQEIPGFQMIGQAAHKGAIISFCIEGVHHLDLATLLDLKGIAIRTGHHCAQPTMQHFGLTGTARISFGVYNTIEEIDQTILALKEVLFLLRR